MIIINIIKPIGFDFFVLFVQLRIRNASDGARIGVAWGYTGTGNFIFILLISAIIKFLV